MSVALPLRVPPEGILQDDVDTGQGISRVGVTHVSGDLTRLGMDRRNRSKEQQEQQDGPLHDGDATMGIREKGFHV
ncbi:MAG: hypothetical protein KatS3mg082_3117 [Nitrospiraceae bacterium]|nr:MAG: hypothetical protein KatS3mg082_3117 [Nitrospiraceae bacterium]